MDHQYMSSLTPAISLPQNRPTNQNPSQGSSPEEEMQRQVNEFNRSVTIIIWYKANTEPIRLQQILPYFPYFRLAQFPNVVNDLNLTGSSYLDTFVPLSHQWEQHTIETVRVVETQQRLLYKIRRTLVDGLSEEDCLSLGQELRIQSQNPPSQHPSITTGSTPPKGTSKPQNAGSKPGGGNDIPDKNPLKRSAAQGELCETGHSPKLHVTNGYYLTHTTTASMAPSSNNAISGSSSNPNPSEMSNTQSNNQDEVYMYQSPVFYTGTSPNADTPTSDTLPHYLLTPHAPAPPIPYHPHPPLKRWPNDYTVSELSSGFHAMDLLIAQSPAGSSMTQRTAFERVFGSRYVKSTVCRHRAVWRKAHRTLREQFEAMGTDDRACWGEFVRRVEGRPPGKNSPHDMMSSPHSSMGYHDRGSTADEEDHQETVMNSMQNQVHTVPSSSNNSNMQNNMGHVYDPSRNHHANSGQSA